MQDVAHLRVFASLVATILEQLIPGSEGRLTTPMRLKRIVFVAADPWFRGGP
jgi:malate synthase